MNKNIKDTIYGLAIGDAMGVPYEFIKPEYIDVNCDSFLEMIGNNSYSKVDKGNWSDDTSLTLASLDSLTKCNSFDKKDQYYRFVNWFSKSHYTSEAGMFDCGITTLNALNHSKGLDHERSCGNGSLMRIIPFVYYLLDEDDVDVRYNVIKEASSMTHAHHRCVNACFVYTEFARRLLINDVEDKSNLNKYLEEVLDYTLTKINSSEEKELFKLFLNLNNISEITGKGYVMNTLTISLYCLLNTNNYEEAILKAISFGYDTDTNAACTGALAGIYYGFDSIPSKWIDTLLNKDVLDNLIDKWNERK